MAAQKTSSLRNWSMTAVYLMLAGLATYGMRILSSTELAVDKYMQAVTTSGQFPNGTPLRRHYTGIAPIDFGLGFLVAAFIDGVSGWDSAFQLQQIHFLFSFFAVISIWEVEACRAGSGLALGKLLFLWTIAYQTVGGAIVIPCYYLAYTWISSRPGYFTSHRRIPVPVAKSLAPALVFGYLVPTIILFWPWKSITTVQGVTALWQPAPLFPIILLLVLPNFMLDAGSQPTKGPADIKHLRRFYILAGIVTTCVHLAEVYVFLSSIRPETSFRQVLVIDLTVARTSPAKTLLFIFQVDFWIIFAASLIWCWQAVWDLRQMNATKFGLPEAAVLIALGSVILGPGAIMCIIWNWREDKMVSLSQEGVKKQR